MESINLEFEISEDVDLPEQPSFWRSQSFFGHVEAHVVRSKLHVNAAQSDYKR